MKIIIKTVLLFVCSFSFAQTNLLDSSTWSIGTGSVTGFNHYGTDVVNNRGMGVGPHGASVLLWERAAGISSTSAGGYITDYVSIDDTKTYRFTVWAKKSNSQDGRYYFAFDAKDSLGNYATNYLISGTSTNYPYFKVGDLPTLDNWYLLVSYVHPTGYTGTTHTGGVYDINGVKVSVTNDFKFQSGAIQTRFKMYFYDQTNINDHGGLYSPTIYEVNGQEPTMQELIDGPSDTQIPTASILSSTAQTDSSVALSWTAATDDTAVTGYKVYKDTVLETTLGNVLSYQVTGLTASTAYNFTVTALDAAGNESVVSNTLAITTNIQADTQAPTAPILSSTAQTDSSVALSWTAATDDTAVTGYKVYKDAVLETTLGNVLSYQVTGLTASTAYNFTVTALDAAGNESVVSNVVGATTSNAIVGNLLDTSTWTVGTGSATGFNRTGVDAENIREMGIGPHSSSVLLWKTVPGTTGSSGAGGWNSDYQNIDPTKTYRFAVWIKKMNSFDGTTYFRARAEDASGDLVVNKLDGFPHVNPYFWSGDPATLDKWYLLVGYMHHNSYSNTVSIGGVYDGVTGTKISDITDYKFQSTATKIYHSIWLTSNTNGADSQFYYDPTMYEVTGQEPTIQQLIDGPPDTQAPTASTLSSTVQTDTTADLSWTAATDNTAVTGYKVYKDAVLETTLGNVLSYQVTGLTASTAYNFTVRALDAAGNESVVSNTLAITTNVQTDTQAPTASTLSSTVQTDTTADLSWTAATDNTAVTGYKVYKDAVLETTLGNVLSSQVTGLTASTAYNFTVTALDAAGNESVVSNTLAITTNVQTDTQAPTTSTLSSTVQTDTTADLSWTAATDNTAVTGYKVYKDAVLETTLGNVLSYQVTGLTASTAYNFTVTAIDAAGNESVVSNTLAITSNAASGGSGNWSLNNQDVYYNAGNVGIGTTTPDEKLTVKGSIHSEEVKVDLSVPAPDYVFYKEYRLTPLEELRFYIEQNKHLPNIPPAKEMEANGIELGVMNMKLLEKIEELTLYILQQQQQIEKLEKRMIKQEHKK